MEHIETSDYYVAYFDVLGYKEYFNQPQEIMDEFSDNLCAAIDETVSVVNNMTSSKMMIELAQMKIEHRIFSDNVLLCLKKSSSPLEIVRILTFLQTVIDIQRKFVLEHGLLLRGGISVGPLFIDDAHLVGKVLIKVVAMEHSVKYPFIAVDESIYKILAEQLVQSADNQTLQYFIKWSQSLLTRMEGLDTGFLDYLKLTSAASLWPVLKEHEDILVNAISGSYSKDAEAIKMLLHQDDEKGQTNILKNHQDILVRQMNRYCNYDDIDYHDEKAVQSRESIIMKYKWIWLYHNGKCHEVNRKDLAITANLTYDTRMFKDIIRINTET